METSGLNANKDRKTLRFRDHTIVLKRIPRRHVDNRSSILTKTYVTEDEAPREGGHKHQ